MNWVDWNEGRADARSREASRAALGLHQHQGGHDVTGELSFRTELPIEPDRSRLGVALVTLLVVVVAALEALGLHLALLF